MSSRSFGSPRAEHGCWQPRLLGTHGAVASHHYLSAQAGAQILRGGGNAVDAAVSAVLVEGLVNPQMHTLGGECPMLIHMAGAPEVIAVNGNTAAPAAATPEAFRSRGLTGVPAEGILAAGVPAAPGALLTALARFGRLPFAEVAAPVLELAREGFPVHRGIVEQSRFGLRALEAKLREQWPASAALYLPGGALPAVGHRLRNPAFADLIEHLCAAERSAGGDRGRGLQAVLDGFYRGDAAAAIGRFSEERDGLLARADLARFETRLEVPAGLAFGDITVFKCGPWTQGPALLQALAILSELGVEHMRPGSARYLHALIEAMKLAFADREQYYADPELVEVPLRELLSPGYAAARAALVDPEHASAELRPGDPRGGRAVLPVGERLGGRAWGPGTVHVDVIDADGSMVSATPSGAWLMSAEVVPALGFPLGNRLMTFYLGPPHHPNVVAPGKRPRTTISPSLAHRGGRPWMVFGSMGGDQQDQWMLQFLLNRAAFGMTIPQAIEAPKLSSEHFPGFFAPHDFHPNRVLIEPRVPAPVRDALARRGHDVELAVDWTEGYLLAAERDPDSGLLEAGCDPRGAKSDVFPATALCW